MAIDGTDVRRYRLKSLRDQISFVLQDTLLFRATIWENIAYGKPNASPGEIRRAAELANAREFIEEMPDGYDTMVGERGVTLSGGQRQRIAIARAIIRDTPILILDEPTAGLDAASEQAVIGALDTLMKGRTSVVIAHHLGTIRSRGRHLRVRRLRTGRTGHARGVAGAQRGVCGIAQTPGPRGSQDHDSALGRVIGRLSSA